MSSPPIFQLAGSGELSGALGPGRYADPDQSAEVFTINRVQAASGAVPRRRSDRRPAPCERHPMTKGLADALSLRSLLIPEQQRRARQTLQQALLAAPEVPALWLHVIALDPPFSEEVALLQGFLRHHPRHPLARTCRQRLHELERNWLQAPLAADAARDPAAAPPQLCFGAFLVLQGVATITQVEQALVAQRRLRAAGLAERLGTVLLLMSQVTPDQLANACAALPPRVPTFGAYLVKEGVLTREQVASALAQQATSVVARDRAVLAAVAAYRQQRRLHHRREECSARLQQRVPRLGEILGQMGLLRPEEVGELLQAYVTTVESGAVRNEVGQCPEPA